MKGWPLLFVFCAPLALQAAEFRFHVVDFPGASDTNLFAVNNRGQFVGEEQDAGALQHAIFDDGRQLELLDPTGLVGTSRQSWAFSINNLGWIAGAYQTPDRALHGFVRDPQGVVTTIEYPGGRDTQAFGINDEGTIIGVFNDSARHGHAFILRGGQFELADLPGAILTIPFSINDRELIVGQVEEVPNTFGLGYLQRPDGQIRLASAPGSQPQSTLFISINNRDQILGAYEPAAGGPKQNFLKIGHDYHLFDLPARFGAIAVSAQTINDPGEIVGFYTDVNQIQHGFVATPLAEAGR
jgi:probable HAF family extracellular repeat protein